MPRSSLANFNAFHEKNPHYYTMFRQFTMEAIRAGRKKFSARTVLHRMRWWSEIEQMELFKTEFKVNNNWSPFYARMFIEENPQYKGIFEMRTSNAD